MSTVLLANSTDPYTLVIRRTTLRERLFARLHSFTLDLSLARGSNPDSTVALSLRAQKLHSAARRRQLARGFRRVLAASNTSAHPLDPSAPLARNEIEDCRELITEIIDLLESDGPVEASGVAQARLLITEGGSPLFRSSLTGALEPSLRLVIDSLTGHE